MIRSNYARAVMLSAVFIAANASTLLAHGFNLPPPPPPPPPPTFSATGGGSVAAGATASTGLGGTGSTGPSLNGGGAFTGPSGGSGPTFTGPVGGGNFGGTGTGGTTPNSEPTTAPAPAGGMVGGSAPTASKPVGGTTQSGRPGAGPSRPKGSRTPWLENLAAPWKPAFLEAEKGYDVSMADLAASVKTFDRSEPLAMVLIFDSSNKHHHAWMEALDTDARFAAPAQLFDCFKIDVRGMTKSSAEIQLSIFKADGTLACDLIGESKVRKAPDALVEVWKTATGKDLSPAMHNMVAAINGIAYCNYVISQTEGQIVCADCGVERQDAIDRIADLKTRRATFQKVIDGQRKH